MLQLILMQIYQSFTYSNADLTYMWSTQPWIDSFCTARQPQDC